jgi:hypothetical protein
VVSAAALQATHTTAARRASERDLTDIWTPPKKRLPPDAGRPSGAKIYPGCRNEPVPVSPDPRISAPAIRPAASGHSAPASCVPGTVTAIGARTRRPRGLPTVCRQRSPMIIRRRTRSTTAAQSRSSVAPALCAASKMRQPQLPSAAAGEARPAPGKEALCATAPTASTSNARTRRASIVRLDGQRSDESVRVGCRGSRLVVRSSIGTIFGRRSVC